MSLGVLAVSKVELNSLKLRAFIYATESEEKVLKALLNLIPPELRDRVAVSRQLVKGHHGNPIVLVQAVLQGGDAEASLRHIASALAVADKSILKASLPLRYDPREKKLSFRLSKQELYFGKLVISDSGDVVHVTLSFSGKASRESVRKLLEDAGLIQ